MLQMILVRRSRMDDAFREREKLSQTIERKRRVAKKSRFVVSSAYFIAAWSRGGQSSVPSLGILKASMGSIESQSGLSGAAVVSGWKSIK